MAKLNFPDPSVTQTYTEAGITWTWNATLGVWSSEAGQVPGGGDVSVDVGDTRPSLPSEGDLWFCTAEAEDGGGRLYVYYEDDDTAQWVDVSQPGGSFSGDYNDLINKPNIPAGFDLEDGSEVNNLIVWRSAGEALTLQISGTDSQHPENNNITYTDMPTTRTSGSGTGMTISYDVVGNKSVSRPRVSFPGSGYKPGDTFTVDGRDFGGTIVTTSSDAGYHPGPDGTSGWYPEAGQDYYVSTRIDSTVNALPTFAAGFIGGRVPGSDTPEDGAYNFYPTGNRSNNFINLITRGSLNFRTYRTTTPGLSAINFSNEELKSDGSYVERFKFNLANDNVASLKFYDEAGNANGRVYFYSGKIGVVSKSGIKGNESVIKQLDNEHTLKFETNTSRYVFGAEGRTNHLELVAANGITGLKTSATTTAGEFGIHHTGSQTVSLKNNVGEIRLNTGGNPVFYKGSDNVTINVANNTAPTQIKGNAPLYVRRAVNADTTTRISSETALELQGDDPTAYQTTYAVDEDGNQVEQQEYIGETETLLEIIRDLRARVEALEGA